MDASTTTTIRGVSIVSRQRTRKEDLFDITLSPDGIAVQRPGRAEQHIDWSRISQWEIVERPGCVVLTLRGGGAVTPLMVKGWSLEDLETVMREVTGPADEWDVPPPSAGTATALLESLGSTPATLPAPTPPRADRRHAARRPRRPTAKVVVTVVLLGLLATAVVVVLLQSAGLIDWSFLGPVA
jgi:hypothetical protein